jgi:hypothetical protein
MMVWASELPMQVKFNNSDFPPGMATVVAAPEFRLMVPDGKTTS